MVLIGVILSTIFIANSITCFIEWGIDKIKISNKDKKTKAEELSKMFEIERSLNEVLNNQRAEINRLKQQISNNSEQDKHMKNNDKQTVYKIEKGDLIGDITGKNVTIVLMQGDIKGNVNAENGEIFLARGNINGDIKADKVVCPQPKTEYEEYIDKLSSVDKLSASDKNEPRERLKDSLAEYLLENPIAPIVRCADCKFMEDTNVTANGLSTHKYCNCSNEGGLGLFDKYAKRVCVCFKKKEPPPDYVNCADCAYGEKYSITPNGCDYYKCSKFDGVIRSEGARICDLFKQKERHTCKSCYHFVNGINESYCSKYHLEKLYDFGKYCPLYDGTGETTNYKSDCVRFSNNSGRCLFFNVPDCPIKNGCPYKVNRGEND